MIKVSLFMSKLDRDKPEWITFSYMSVDEFREFFSRLWMKVSGVPAGKIDYKLLKQIRHS
jgi:hypothetical protein